MSEIEKELDGLSFYVTADRMVLPGGEIITTMPNDMLLEVTYSDSNHSFVEKTTGQEFLCGSSELALSFIDDQDSIDEEFYDYEPHPLAYEFEKFDEWRESNGRAYDFEDEEYEDYLLVLDNFEYCLENIPYIIRTNYEDFDRPCIRIDDDSREEYSRFTDEDRKKVIEEYKQQANIKAQELLGGVRLYHESFKKVYDEAKKVGEQEREYWNKLSQSDEDDDETPEFIYPGKSNR